VFVPADAAASAVARDVVGARASAVCVLIAAACRFQLVFPCCILVQEHCRSVLHVQYTSVSPEVRHDLRSRGCCFISGMGAGEGSFTSSVYTATLKRGHRLKVYFSDDSALTITWAFIRQYARKYTYIAGFQALASGVSTTAGRGGPRDDRGLCLFLANGPSLCLGIVEYSFHEEQRAWMSSCARLSQERKFPVIRKVRSFVGEEDAAEEEAVEVAGEGAGVLAAAEEEDVREGEWAEEDDQDEQEDNADEDADADADDADAMAEAVHAAGDVLIVDEEGVCMHS